MVAQLTMPVLPRFGVPMQGYVFLALAIIAEVIATTALKSLDGLNKPLPLLLVVVGYALAFAMLALVMRSIPVGVAYALWSGLGIVLISLAAWLIYGQRLDTATLLGMALIISGVAVIQLFSTHNGH
jgi:small multidrug resistance pump